jgi:hypothetical protein
LSKNSYCLNIANCPLLNWRNSCDSVVTSFPGTGCQGSLATANAEKLPWIKEDTRWKLRPWLCVVIVSCVLSMNGTVM